MPLLPHASHPLIRASTRVAAPFSGRAFARARVGAAGAATFVTDEEIRDKKLALHADLVDLYNKVMALLAKKWGPGVFGDIPATPELRAEQAEDKKAWQPFFDFYSRNPSASGGGYISPIDKGFRSSGQWWQFIRENFFPESLPSETNDPEIREFTRDLKAWPPRWGMDDEDRGLPHLKDVKGFVPVLGVGAVYHQLQRSDLIKAIASRGVQIDEFKKQYQSAIAGKPPSSTDLAPTSTPSDEKVKAKLKELGQASPDLPKPGDVFEGIKDIVLLGVIVMGAFYLFPLFGRLGRK